MGKLNSLINYEGMDKVSNWSKLIEILTKAKDLNLCKRLLRISRNQLSQKHVADLIIEFGWDQLKEKLNLLPVTLENVTKNNVLVNVRDFNFFIKKL